MTRPHRELGGHRGNPPDEVTGGAVRPAHRAGERTDARIVADRDDGRETHTEPADRCLVRIGPPLAGGAQRGQRRDPRRVQRRSYVRCHERSGAQRQPQPARHSPARRRVGRVLRQLHHDAVTVTTERVVFLRVGVLTEPRGRRRPRVEHPTAQLRGAERVGLAVMHSVDPPPLHSARRSGSLTRTRCSQVRAPAKTSARRPRPYSGSVRHRGPVGCQNVTGQAMPKSGAASGRGRSKVGEPTQRIINALDEDPGLL